jgi:hypothetical protein
MIKKLSILIIVILVISLLIFALWYFFFNTPNNQNLQPIEDDTQGRFFPLNTQTDDDDFFDDSTEGGTINDRVNLPRLRQISQVPTAGFVSFERIASTSDTFIEEDGSEEEEVSFETIFRYLERGTGHLYETKENTLTTNRLSNVTMPGIQDALFNTEGDNVLLRFLDQFELIQTYSAVLEEKTSTSTESSFQTMKETKLTGEYFPVNISEVAVSPEDEIFYLTGGETGSEGTAVNFNGSDKVPLYSSPISEWLIEWPSLNTISITSKADSRLSGFMYFINSRNGEVTKILDDIKGLTTLTSPDLKYVLYSESVGSRVETHAYNTTTDTSSKLSISTLPEKCTWSSVSEGILYCAAPKILPRMPYPETWYQGLTFFNDFIWEINIEEGTQSIVLDPETEGQSFDVVKPKLSPEDEYLLFINKRDLTLWSLDLLAI